MPRIVQEASVFVNHFRVSCCFTTNKNFFLHNHDTAISIRKLALFVAVSSSFISCPNNAYRKGPYPGSFAFLINGGIHVYVCQIMLYTLNTLRFYLSSTPQ